MISQRIYNCTVTTVLDVWSQKLEFVKCEEPSSLDVVLRHFYCDSLSWFEPSACAVALVGWSLADIGIIWDRIESQVSLFNSFLTRYEYSFWTKYTRGNTNIPLRIIVWSSNEAILGLLFISNLSLIVIIGKSLQGLLRIDFRIDHSLYHELEPNQIEKIF